MSQATAQNLKPDLQPEPAAARAAAPAVVDRFPAGIPFIVGNEGAERFSFYGMKAILWVYLVSLFGRIAGGEGAEATAAAEAHATEVTHLFVAGVYAFPLVGAIVSDRWLGKYRVIFWVSILYCVGHAILAIAGRLDVLGSLPAAAWAMQIGLGVIAFSSGGIKPCVSANVGDQFSKENGHLVTKVFQIFYFMINFGSFISTLLTPLLYRWWGPEVAFGVPGVLMAVATLIYWWGRDKFTKVPAKPGGVLGFLDSVVTILLLAPLLIFAFGGILPALADYVWSKDPFAWNTFGALLLSFWPQAIISVACFAVGMVLFTVRQNIQPDNSFLPVLVYALRMRNKRKPGQSFFDPAREKFGEEAGDGPPAVLRIIVVFSMVSVFWALFDQHASTWVAQAGQMGLHLTVPGTLFYWGIGATILLTLYGGAWVICMVSNIHLPRKLTFGVIGAVLALGAIAGLNDAFGKPLGDVVDGQRTAWRTMELAAAQLSALNPLMVMIIIPLLNVAVYAPLRKRGIEVKPLQKMTVGMFLAGFAFAAAAVLQKIVESSEPGSVHSLWQFIQYFVMTTSEVLVSITGLEFAYTQAPRAMKSTIMGFWLLCVTFGNLLVAFLAPLQEQFPLSQFFWVFAGLMVGAAVIFAVLAYFYRGKTYLQEAAA